jgi:hypothetical protein
VSGTDRKGKDMREESIAWRRAGYPEVTCGRYRDAADQVDRMFAVLLKCRDALPAITEVRRQLYGVPHDLDKQIETVIEPWRIPDSESEASPQRD